MSTTKDTGQVITVPITTPDAVVTLRDRMYVSVTASTASHPRDTHMLRVNLIDGEVSMHFENLHLALSVDDWHRVAQTVLGAIWASEQTVAACDGCEASE